MRPLAATVLLALAVPAQSPAPREFRGAWIATVDNIDWPSKKGLPVAEQRREMTHILDAAQALRLNALIFQVRPCADALYASPFEPWSEWLTGKQGQAPEPAWDPLQAWVEGAHARGMELHAWFNPYRARHPASTTPNAPNHVANVDGLCVRYGDYEWMDPGHPQAALRTLRAILDVVVRYDVDGVHLDDYFYPYPVKGQTFPDDRTWANARARGFKGERFDWRRKNVDDLVADIHRRVHATKPWVKFGISPFGIARPGLPAGIAAGIDQYADLYADVQKWLAEGWCDYFAPQLYWPIAQTKQAYPVLLAWWPTQNPKGRHLWVGNYTSKTGSAGWPKDELLSQIELTRGEKGVTGNIHFSVKALLRDQAGLATALRSGPYAERALVPASPWLDDVAPAAPEVVVEQTGGKWRLRPKAADADVRFFVLYVREGDKWACAEVRGGEGVVFERASAPDQAMVTALDRAGNESAGKRL